MNTDDTSNLVSHKICSKDDCSFGGEPQPLENFYLNKRKKDVWRACCRTCVAADGKLYRETNPDKDYERHRVYNIKNVDKVRARERAYRESNADKIRDRKRERSKNDPDYYKSYAKKWREANPEYQKERYARSPERHRAVSQRRRTLKHSLPATLTHAEWEMILDEYNYSCAYCGKAEHEIKGRLAQEHVIPLIQQGGYTKENIVPACKSCNSKKCGRTPDQAGMQIIKPTNQLKIV